MDYGWKRARTYVVVKESAFNDCHVKKIKSKR